MILVKRSKSHLIKVQRLRDFATASPLRIMRLSQQLELPDSCVEEVIVKLDSALLPHMEDLEDEVVLTSRFLQALAEVDLCDDPDSRRELNLRETDYRSQAFDKLEVSCWTRRRRRLRRFFQHVFGI